MRADLVASEDFRNGTQVTVDVGDFVVDLEIEREVSLVPIRNVIAEAMNRADKAKSDMWLGPRVHATLRLTRREAADKRLWDYLTVAEFPDYVRWRWKEQDDNEGATPIVRFCGPNNLNAISRLWWTAEMTRNGSDYSMTEKALSISQFDYLWLGLNCMHHRAASLAVTQFLAEFSGKGANNPQTRAMAKAVNLALRTVSLDRISPSPALDADAVRDWIAEKVDETAMFDELPLGPDEKRIDDENVLAVRAFLDNLAQRIGLVDVKAKRQKPQSD